MSAAEDRQAPERVRRVENVGPAALHVHDVEREARTAVTRITFPGPRTPQPEPTPDQSYCEVSRHQQCTGYTMDEADPETCMCECHVENQTI